jgi:hypothetical protein
MDPDESIRLMLEAFSEEDYDLAIELANALLRWLKIGGFPPTVSVVAGSERVELTEMQANRAVTVAVAQHVLATAISLSDSR